MTNPGSITARVPYGADAAVRKQGDLARQVKANAAARSLAASQIGSGGTLLVNGSLQVTGSITVPGTLASAGAISAGTDVDVGGNVVAPNGTLVSTYARNHQVVTGYVSAWLDSSGNLLATASSERFKRDIEDYAAGAWRTIRTVRYRLRAAWILADMCGDDLDTVPYEVGVLAEELLAAGYPELVVLDAEGKPWSVHYERLAVVALSAAQQLADRVDAQDDAIASLARRLDRLENDPDL